jgi:hypothetical protein
MDTVARAAVAGMAEKHEGQKKDASRLAGVG